MRYKYEDFNHSVTLDKEKCKGCTHCLKRCPTEAIRIRDGRARIIAERCIDCGECIRICPYHAKVAVTDPIDHIYDYKYKIALPAPTLYGQFKNLSSIDAVLNGLYAIGFDDVFEVARGAEVVSKAIREKVLSKDLPRPLISSACPAVVRLIQVRFPELIHNIVDLKSPMETSAMIARKEFCKHFKVDPKDVGCFFITPCAAKMTAVRNPIGHNTSAVDGCISMVEIYGLLSTQAHKIPENHVTSDRASAYGVGWATTGGEVSAVGYDNSLSVDGIDNVIHVLEEIENNKLSDLEFFEGLACHGGCVGGPLVFENSFVAKNRIRKLGKSLPKVRPEDILDKFSVSKEDLHNEVKIEAKNILQLDDDIVVALAKMEQIEKIASSLPGLDCGSCGSPTCKALAEDIVKGYARELDCVHRLKERFKSLAKEMVEIAETKRK